jgi:hypothetical protein
MPFPNVEAIDILVEYSALGAYETAKGGFIVLQGSGGNCDEIGD